MLIHSLKLESLLSFKNELVELKPLNVIIGPNGAGKSNFIEAISLLKAIPNDLVKTVYDGGGVREWMWKGSKPSTACLECILPPPSGGDAVR